MDNRLLSYRLFREWPRDEARKQWVRATLRFNLVGGWTVPRRYPRVALQQIEFIIVRPRARRAHTGQTSRAISFGDVYNGRRAATRAGRIRIYV